MKTRERIIKASIALFNKQGERNVTTNHIAADLGISPGNLYYHFRNKEDIILSIYEEYARSLLLNTMPQVSPDIKPLNAIIIYMDAVFQATIKFRFFYSNLPVLLAKDPQLHDKYVEVQGIISQRVSELLLSLRDSKIMAFSDDDLPEIVSILRLVNTFWVSFYQTQISDTEIKDSVFFEGVLKILVIIKPYITESANEAFIEARETYLQRFNNCQTAEKASST